MRIRPHRWKIKKKNYIPNNVIVEDNVQHHFPPSTVNLQFLLVVSIFFNLQHDIENQTRLQSKIPTESIDEDIKKGYNGIESMQWYIILYAQKQLCNNNNNSRNDVLLRLSGALTLLQSQLAPECQFNITIRNISHTELTGYLYKSQHKQNGSVSKIKITLTQEQ